MGFNYQLRNVEAQAQAPFSLIELREFPEQLQLILFGNPWPRVGNGNGYLS